MKIVASRIKVAANATAEQRVRFWLRVDIGEADECWEWQGAKSAGYGRMESGGVRHMAHRFAYISVRGPVDSDLFIDHICRNPACCNPLHLEPVTPRQNVLRGVSFAVSNARKTHCPRGHPYDEENTYVTPKGWRECWICKRRHRLTYRRRKPLSVSNHDGTRDTE